MHYAIIAAGEGSRLAQEGLEVPKPLVRLGGRCMLERLLDIFVANGAESVSVIVNAGMTAVGRFLEDWGSPARWVGRGLPPDFPFRVLVQSTPSSMHSLAALSRLIPAGKFCLTTVDTVFREEEFAAYIRRFQEMPSGEGDGLFAVTAFVDDEKPLYVSVGPDDYISDFSDTKPAGRCFVSGGVYCLDTRTAFPVLADCLASGQSRMRNYQRALVGAGLRLKVFPFAKIIDVDHVADIRAAEVFINV